MRQVVSQAELSETNIVARFQLGPKRQICPDWLEHSES